MSEKQTTDPFFDASMQCEECNEMGMRQVEGGGGVMVWQCIRCRAEQVFGQEEDGTWTRLTASDGGEA